MKISIKVIQGVHKEGMLIIYAADMCLIIVISKQGNEGGLPIAHFLECFYPFYLCLPYHFDCITRQ